MNKLVDTAAHFIGADSEQIAELFDYYNEHCAELVKASRRYNIQTGDNWCAMFASVCGHLAGYGEGDFPFEVSVYYQVQAAKTSGTFITRLGDYTRGDLIIYDWLGGGAFEHVGIVEKVTAREITAIEGNYSGTVKRRVIRRSSRAIAGFIRIGDRSPLNHHKQVVALVKDVLSGVAGDGDARREYLGAYYHEVQEKVNEILK